MNKQQNIKKLTLDEYQQLNHNNDDLDSAKKGVIAHYYDNRTGDSILSVFYGY